MRNQLISLVVVAVTMLAGAASAAETYTIDPVHSSVAFSAKHMVIANVKGTFEDIEGKIVYDADDITQSSVEVAIDVASVNTRNERRDGHLRSSDFFDVENHPKITFKSTQISETDDGFVARGDLTIRGVTKQVDLPFTVAGPIKDPYGNMRIGVDVDTVKLNRHDFGVSWNDKLDNGGLIVGDEIKVDLAVEAIKK